ncbi:VOC family protein [Mesorhizobium comanense]|uniref:VOC family protein n=1 Tax=Mesorhizobium comanense TaxID=2502215 RepID=UPI0010F5711B|nr:VOC family protein [Mesorhizobium comanense]
MHNTISATNHTSFTVGSLDRAIALFRDGLGFELTSRAGRDPASIQTITGVAGAKVEIAYLRRPDHTVELIEYTGPDDRRVVEARPCDVGFAHIAFDVTDLDGAIAHLALYGAVAISPPYVNKRGGPNAGVRVSYLTTPDKVTVELIERV